MPRTMTTDTRIVAADYVVMPIFMNLTSITAATLWRWTPGKPGQIISLDFIVAAAVVTASDAATVTAHIAGTATTGGAVALTSANATPAGTKVAGSAITGNRTFTASQEITLVGSSVTAFAEGDGHFMLAVEFNTLP